MRKGPNTPFRTFIVSRLLVATIAGTTVSASLAQDSGFIEHIDGVPIRLHLDDFYVQSEPIDSYFPPQYRAGYRAG
ncbi:hypothetical protein BH24CHL3_BH24CHL3_00250 [soil metagenome]